jgi:2-dehydro-3-deoxygluconokinase
VESNVSVADEERCEPRGALAFAGEGLAELTLDGDRSALNCGGDAANAAVMAARLGAATKLLGRVGDDPLGRRLLTFWRNAGIDTSAIVVDSEAPTGLYVNEISRMPGQADRPFMYWRRGSAGSRWSPTDITDSATWSGLTAVVFTAITVAVSDTSAAAVWSLIEHARSRSIPVACILNYRSALAHDPAVLARLVTLANVLIASVDDLHNAFPAWTPVQIFDLMREPQPELVLTAGPAGASVIWSAGTIRQPAPSVVMRDTVGAGDALAGAYLCARFHRQESPAESLAWGVAAASLSVQRDGCASSYPDGMATAAARARLRPATRHLAPVVDTSPER